MMRARKTFAALLVTAALLSPLLAGLGSAGSHYPLSVQLWNQDAVGLTTGQTYRVWAQVNLADIPTNATTVTFRVGLGVLSSLLPATSYAGNYAGSPGLYSAVVTVTFLEATAGLTGLSVAVRQGNDTANNFRQITLAPLAPPPDPANPWTLSAGVENLLEIGPTLDPGERVVWRIDTYNLGTHANAGSLTLDLFSAPHVDFTQTPVTVTPSSAGTGIYTATTSVPAGITESRQYVLQATIDEANFARTNASADVWFLDTIVAFSQFDTSMINGELTVGDGTVAIAGADISLQLTEAGVPSHSVGPIQGQADATGKFTFSVPNDGTTSVAVRGWINETGTHSQYVARTIRLPAPYTPPNPVATRFDAVPQQDLSMMRWNGVRQATFQFFANGTLWTDSDVVALVSTARGPLGTTLLTTDSNGEAALTVDFGSSGPSQDDCLNQGINLTFRASTGIDAAASDGAWWGEDEEVALPDPTMATLRCVLDTRLSFTTVTLTPGQPFGVGVKYTGTKDVSNARMAALLAPGGLESIFGGGSTGPYDVWTGHDQPFVAGGVRGIVPEFFAQLRVPSYWPDTTYTLLAALVAHYSVLGSASDPSQISALSWITLSPGQSASAFVPAIDGTPPQIFTPANFSMDLGNNTTLWSNAYDDSLDFGTAGQYEWTVGTVPAQMVLPGNEAIFTPDKPGDWPVTLRVTDGDGNVAIWNFTITVFDVKAPSVDAGIDFIAYGGLLANFSGVALDDDPAMDGGATVNWSFIYNGSQVVLTAAQAYPNVSASFVFWTLGVYAVTLTAEDPSGLAATDVLYVTVVSPDVEGPAVDAGPVSTVNASQSASFTGSATDNDLNFPLGATCWWTFDYNGSAHNITGFSFSFTFWVVQAVDLRFHCVDFWGNEAQDATTVFVDRPDKEPPLVSAGPDLEVAQGAVVTATGTATDNDPGFAGAARYWWIFSNENGVINQSGPIFSFSFNLSGDFSIILYVEDGWGNVGTDALTIHVTPPDTVPPTVTPINDFSILEGQWINTTAQVTDNFPDFATNGTLRWTWLDHGTPSERFGASFSVHFTEVGNHVVTLRATDAAGNFAEATFTVHVSAVVPPDATPPTATASADDLDVVAGTLVTFAGTATDAGAAITDGARFTWRFTYNGTAQVLNGTSPTFTFAVAGTYLVSLSVTDAAGNIGTAQVTITVTESQNPPPPPPPPTGGDSTMLLLLALLVAGGAAAFIIVSRRHRDAPKMAEGTAAPGVSGRVTQDTPDKREPDEMDKDLDDLLN